MFFVNTDTVLEIFGVFKIKRNLYNLKSSRTRSHDSLSIRLNGQCLFEEEKGNKFTVTENDLLYIPHTANYTQHTTGEEIIAVHFINYNGKENLNMEMFSTNTPEFYRKEFEKMYEIWNEKKTGYRLKCASILYDVLYNTAVNMNENNSTKEIDTVLKASINYIHQNYKKTNISISELAKSLYVSDTYLRRIFKKVYGVSPNRYIISLKLEYASQMLASGHYSVSDVSENAGFSDQKYFSRIFKKYYHKSPSEYKKEYIL